MDPYGRSGRLAAVTLATGLPFLPLLHAQNQCQAPDRLATQTPFQSTHFNGAPGQNNNAGRCPS